MIRSAATTRPAAHLAGLAIALCAALALLLGSADVAAAGQGKKGAQGHERKAAKRGHGEAKRSQARARAKRSHLRAKRMQAQRRHRAQQRRKLKHRRGAKLADRVALGAPRKKAPAPVEAPSGVIDAGFEAGLFNWNTAGVGDVTPAVAPGIVRSGGYAGDFTLSGGQERSELILGGNGNGSVNNAIRFEEGAEGFYAFSFFIESMTYGRPGGHNLIMQFKGDDDGSPNFALQLWDYEGDDDGESGGRGLWSHSDAMDGDRFLAPAAEQQWHDVLIHFKASRVGAGFYELYLDGALTDARNGVSIIPPDASYVYIKNGIYRNPASISGTSELRVDAAKLGPTAASVVPG